MRTKRSTLSISHTSGARHRLPNSSLLSTTLRLLADLIAGQTYCENPSCAAYVWQMPFSAAKHPEHALHTPQQDDFHTLGEVRAHPCQMAWLSVG